MERRELEKIVSQLGGVHQDDESARDQLNQTLQVLRDRLQMEQMKRSLLELQLTHQEMLSKLSGNSNLQDADPRNEDPVQPASASAAADDSHAHTDISGTHASDMLEGAEHRGLHKPTSNQSLGESADGRNTSDQSPASRDFNPFTFTFTPAANGTDGMNDTDGTQRDTNPNQSRRSTFDSSADIPKQSGDTPVYDQRKYSDNTPQNNLNIRRENTASSRSDGRPRTAPPQESWRELYDTYLKKKLKLASGAGATAG